MSELRMQTNWKRLYLCGIIGLLIFIPIQFLPATSSAFFGNESFHAISKADAQQKATAFVEDRFGGNMTSAKAVHQSDKVLNGYLAREKLADKYEEEYGAQYPADTYQVEVRSKEAGIPFNMVRFVQLNMETGKVVAWDEVKGTANPEVLPFKKAALAAKAFAMEKGFHEADLKLRDVPGRDGTIILDVHTAKIGQAELELHIRPVSTGGNDIQIAVYKPVFEAPQSYISYVDKQDKLASILTLAGYLLLTAVMFILAIVYAALYRKHTSFLRGLLLTAVFSAAYIYNNFNMADGIRASVGERADVSTVVSATMIITVLFTVGMAVSVYFSLVAGDGLWRQMKRNQWPRWGEAGYGEHVWKAMKVGYWYGFIILGLQTLILIGLEKGIGAWSTSDVTQSPLNMNNVWLFPLLAWCAAISEEAIYRLFGIALFRKWFKNTYAAAIIPTVVWALGHVSYPVYPAETRLIELTMLGFVFCYVFVRFGFIASVFTHAIMDSILMSISLLFLGSAGNIIAAVIYMLLPLPIAWLIRFWHQKKEPRPKVTAPPEALR